MRDTTASRRIAFRGTGWAIPKTGRTIRGAAPLFLHGRSFHRPAGRTSERRSQVPEPDDPSS